MRAKSVSVVIASGAGGDFLFRCLDSLRGQAKEESAEVIVVDRCGGEKLARVEMEYPFVTVVPTDPKDRLSVPELRAMGVKKAKGEIVATIEEHCVAPPHWLHTILTSFQEEDVAIGGPICDRDYDRIRDWVVYFSEYHNYLPPWEEGERYSLNGANIAYRRQKLLDHQEILPSGYWEVVLHPQLASEGFFRSVPHMGVYHTGPFNYGYYLTQRYLLSRVWGAMQREKVSFMGRLVYLIIAPILPFLLLARIARRVSKSGHRVGKFFIAFPLLVGVAIAYVWGEWLGYLTGPGDALERVE
jgi:glycosyltransferase involved in cell wall biosynthesis